MADLIYTNYQKQYHNLKSGWHDSEDRVHQLTFKEKFILFSENMLSSFTFITSLREGLEARSSLGVLV